MIAQFIDFYSVFIQSSSIQYETDNVRSRSNKLSVLVHSLNILKLQGYLEKFNDGEKYMKIIQEEVLYE